MKQQAIPVKPLADIHLHGRIPDFNDARRSFQYCKHKHHRKQDEQSLKDKFSDSFHGSLFLLLCPL